MDKNKLCKWIALLIAVIVGVVFGLLVFPETIAVNNFAIPLIIMTIIASIVLNNKNKQILK